jgi:hypothetical protein
MDSFRISRSVLVVFSILLGGLGNLAPAQQPPARKATSKPEERKKNQALVQSALTALDSVIDELPQVEDLQARLAVAEGVVKALAKSRPNRCRKVLDSLFDAARQARQAASSDKRVASPNPDAIIERIVQLATLFDAKLAESYIERYSSPDDSSGVEDEASSKDPAQAASLRLRMALELIDKAPASSVSIAESSLSAGVFPETLAFLGSLRKKDLRLANKFFVDALASVERRRGDDVNELLLLYAYVFSPLRVPVVSPGGIGTYNIPAYLAVAQDYPVEPALARLYLDAAGQMLLDQNRLNPQNLQLLTSGLEGDYYFISIIQPASASFSPALAAPLAVRRSVVAAMLQQDRREDSEAAADRWNKIPANVSLTGAGNSATVDYLIERAEKTSDPVRKDQLFYRAATTAVAAKEYERALDIVDKLSDKNRSEARQFIIFHIASKTARDHQVDKAEFYARRDDDLSRRAFIFTVIAAGLIEGKGADPDRARGFLGEVQQLAAKLNKEDERVAVLFGLVSVYSRFDAALASESLPLAIQSANRVEDFGRVTGIQRGLNLGDFLFDYSMYREEFTFLEGIKTLGARDFDGTLAQIRVLKSRLPRLKATVIICGAVLSSGA